MRLRLLQPRFYATLILFFVFSSFTFAEEKLGDALELSQETILLNSPKKSASPIGKLPKGTILTFQGEKENGFAFVRVELVDGEAEGWVAEKAIQVPKSSEKIQEAAPNAKIVRKGPPKRSQVPKDEAALIRRELSFLYGVYLGTNFSVINTQFTEGLYTGMGVAAGGHVGFFVDKDLTLRGEFGYSLVNGAGDGGSVGFGLFDIGAHLDYNLDRFILSGGLQYSMGVGVGNLPRTITINGAGDASSLWVVLGGGVRFPASEFVSFVLRGRYAISLVRAPIGFQSLSILGYLEVRG